jgi:hypothetical protein
MQALARSCQSDGQSRSVGWTSLDLLVVREIQVSGQMFVITNQSMSCLGINLNTSSQLSPTCPRKWFFHHAMLLDLSACIQVL